MFRAETFNNPRNRIAGWVRTATAPWNIRGFPRLLYASRHQLLGSNRGLFRLRDDFGLFLDPDDYIHCMMFYDRYSRELLNVFRAFVRPGDTVIDIGAHIGYFTTHLANLVTRSGKVYSFEPDPRALEFLKESITANDMHWVQVFSRALAAEKGTIDFYLAEGLGSSSAVKSVQQINCEQTVVQTCSLDELVSDGEIVGKTSLLKIDVEGLEVDVISGMVNLLGRDRPHMIVEVNERMLQGRGHSSMRLFELLKSLDYGVEALVRPRRGKFPVRVITKPVTPNGDLDHYYDVLCFPV